MPKETNPIENRVAQTPDSVKALVKAGFNVAVQSGAGDRAKFSDAMYEAAGASVVPDAAGAWSKDIVLKLRAPTADEATSLGDRTLVSMLYPGENPALVEQLHAQKATVFAMDCIPRTLSRGQAFDALSSQANIAGYRAVLEAAHAFGRFFAGQMTAAGKVPPAKVLVLGGGVAGLAAIQTAKNMGAVVRGFDVRAAAKEQVESMGASFLEVDFQEDGSAAGGYAKEMSKEWFAAADKMLEKQCEEVDIVVSTALIQGPAGRKAPLLLKPQMVKNLKRGSIVVDLAAEAPTLGAPEGAYGNCSATKPGESYVTDGGVTVRARARRPLRRLLEHAP